MSRLITASLIASVDWFMKCPPNWKERAWQGLRDSLSRAPWDPTLAIKKGIAFENDVYQILGDMKVEELKQFASTCSEELQKFLMACNGGRFQNKNKEFIDIDDEEYCLYVKEDVVFPINSPAYEKGHIIDIKTSGKWGGKSKYLGTWQHKLYCYVERIPTFQYLVAVWKDADSEDRKIESVHTADYEVPEGDFKALREDVVGKVKEVVNFLSADDELWELYTTKFSRF